MNSKTFPLIGYSLIAIGIIHNAVGFTLGWTTLGETMSDGLIGAFDGDPTREFLFWFLITGFITICLGLLIARLERSGTPLPRSFTIAFGLLTLVGIMLMPASGIWLLLIPAITAVIREFKTPAVKAG